MNRPLALIVTCLVVGLAACSKREPEPEPVRAVRTQSVVIGAAGGTREFAAEVRARTEARLGFRVGGKLVARPAEIGQRVRAGQLLAQLDPEDLRQGQEAARAALRAAEASFELASAELRRYRELREQGFISALELERRSLSLSAAQAQLDQARAQAVVQRNQATYSSLTATGPGIVTAVDAEVGTVVAAGAPVLRLALDGPRDAVFAIPEDALAQIRPLLGKVGAMSVRLWGDGAVVRATLREIAASADPSTRTFQAKADLGAVTVQMGQTATVMVEAARVDGVVKLPLTAVVRFQDKTSVWIVDRATMTVRPVPVVVAGADRNEAVIASGLAAGQDVVTAGAHVLTAGQKVRFYAAPTAAAASAAAAAR